MHLTAGPKGEVSRAAFRTVLGDPAETRTTISIVIDLPQRKPLGEDRNFVKILGTEGESCSGVRREFGNLRGCAGKIRKS